MNKKRSDDTNTTEFEVDSIEEAYASSSSSLKAPLGHSWQPKEMPRLEVETPPELQDPAEHTARIWILERRARGVIATVKRWFVGSSRR